MRREKRTTLVSTQDKMSQPRRTHTPGPKRSASQPARTEGQAESQAVRERVAALAPEIETLYRDLHAHPELSMQETRTAGIVARRLGALDGWEVTPDVGK